MLIYLLIFGFTVESNMIVVHHLIKQVVNSKRTLMTNNQLLHVIYTSHNSLTPNTH